MFKGFSLLTLGLLISAIISGCGDTKDHRGIVQKHPGAWQKTAYGEALDITAQSLSRYEFNTYACIKVAQYSLPLSDEFEVAQVRLRNKEQLQLTYTGEVYPHIYDRQASLPEVCQSPLSVSTDASPVQVFEYFWHAFNDYYAFFALRDMDWQAQYAHYRPQVQNEMSDDALFDVLTQMIDPLADGHVSVARTPGHPYFVMKDAPILRAARGTASYYLRYDMQLSDEQVFSELVLDSLNVSQQYLLADSIGSFPAELQEKTLLWGRTKDNVGVLVINNLSQYSSDSDADETEHLDAATVLIDNIMTELADTDGLILDIRNNIGGDDAIALAIASRFNSSSRLAFNKQALNRAGQGVLLSQSLNAHPKAYTQPVYLLTSQLTISAGEVFAMAMMHLPHVTLLGEETSGALSDMRFFTLPNGWEISLSNEVYRDAQGMLYEQKGIQPDISVPAFSMHALESGRFESYDLALNLLGKNTTASLSVNEFERQITALQQQGNIPAVAVNIIHHGQSVYKKGFGQADTQGTAVDAHSRFYLGSVSKTLLGATLAHAVEQQQVHLDIPIVHYLNFSIDFPTPLAQAITLRQLITHTSGIMDFEDVYRCNYYIREDGGSLYNRVSQNPVCAEPVDTHPGKFFSAYLTQSGSNYHTQNFVSRFGLTNNQAAIYTNIGSALAGYVTELASGKTLPELTQHFVFTPLAMARSEWAIAAPRDAVVQRYIHHPESQQLVPLPAYGNITYSEGSAISTAHDLGNFLIAAMQQGQFNGQQSLSANAVSAMLSPQTPVPSITVERGYFWGIDGDKIYHSGDDPGVLTQIYGDLRHQSGFVLLTNGDSGNEASAQAYDDIEQLVLLFSNSFSAHTRATP
ncbi:MULTISPECIES: serine hydrolase [unclassified Pseudoalteromonas]|uniref:serine hydrolase n=1 Tax=unclassified Pseudoalteromonas TaxID=194690 RepID=UPI00209837C3|nr:serine hydrolase [Pseudoalteromonas sp. XMcav2-N]MCO7191081.1 serine hydrolase [Pseudoalteromonas sp. XMcav2-N]